MLYFLLGSRGPCGLRKLLESPSPAGVRRESARAVGGVETAIV